MSPPDRSQAQAVKGQPKSEKQARAAPRYSVPPTFSNVPYGDHPRQVLDFFKADTQQPAPLVIHIHGGGWIGGDKVGVADLAHGRTIGSSLYRGPSPVAEPSPGIAVSGKPGFL
ncbi:MAG TPA: hypothetical protein VFF52_23210 [Isosphaeraceae bacterium]|nr:hypothetical protein [Isosphaeraceae bacterium]